MNFGKRFLDRAGLKYGRLTAIAPLYVRGHVWYWNCLCDCGNFKTVQGGHLGKSIKSCGCITKEGIRKLSFVHGLSNTPTYRVWAHMKERCESTEPRKRIYYLDRGITVCDRWLNSFENFIADMGERPSASHSIDRIDNNKGYSPDNCRWVTNETQQSNKRSNKRIVFNGESRTQTEWSKHIGLSRAGVASRLRSGWSVELAVTTPPMEEKRRK